MRTGGKGGKFHPRKELIVRRGSVAQTTSPPPTRTASHPQAIEIRLPVHARVKASPKEGLW